MPISDTADMKSNAGDAGTLCLSPGRKGFAYANNVTTTTARKINYY